MGVIRTEKPLMEVNEAGNRFEVEIVLRDKAGQNIGAVSLVFAYQPGTDREALRRAGEKIRDEIRGQIPSLTALFQPAVHGA